MTVAIKQASVVHIMASEPNQHANISTLADVAHV